MAGIRWVTLLLIFLTGHTAPVVAQDEGTAIEFNVTDFVPLEVGNRWTFSHGYRNEMYDQWYFLWDDSDGENWSEEEAEYWEAYFSPFRVPGDTLLGKSPPDEIDTPDRSLTHPDPKQFTLEITHTEFIDGFEYFVFNEPPYDWPPLPGFGVVWNEQWDPDKGLFFAGNKVRLSEDGVLFFRLDGVDVPVFDFRMPSIGWDSNDLGGLFARDLRSGYPDPRGIPGISRQMKDMFQDHQLRMYPDQLVILVNPVYRNQALEVVFYFTPFFDIYPSDWNASPLTPEWTVHFLNGFGMSRVTQTWVDLHYWEPLSNGLRAFSAIISGKEVSDIEAMEKFLLLVEPVLPPVVGKRDTLSSGGGAFDFSEGTFKEYGSTDGDLVIDGVPDGTGFYNSVLRSSMAIADLGEIDFNRLVDEGSGYLEIEKNRDSFSRRNYPREGHVYAVLTPEGGLAVMHVVFVVKGRRWLSPLEWFVFDWVYYPTFNIPPIETSIKTTSWGRVKKSLRKE